MLLIRCPMQHPIENVQLSHNCYTLMVSRFLQIHYNKLRFIHISLPNVWIDKTLYHYTIDLQKRSILACNFTEMAEIRYMIYKKSLGHLTTFQKLYSKTCMAKFSFLGNYFIRILCFNYIFYHLFISRWNTCSNIYTIYSFIW